MELLHGGAVGNFDERFAVNNSLIGYGIFLVSPEEILRFFKQRLLHLDAATEAPPAGSEFEDQIDVLRCFGEMRRDDGVEQQVKLGLVFAIDYDD